MPRSLAFPSHGLVFVVLASALVLGCENGGEPATDGGPVVPGRDAGPPAPGTDGGPPPAPRDAASSTDCAGGPLAEPIPGCRPTPLPSTGDPAQDCVDRINQFRWECQCMPPLERWTEGEMCADMHAEYDVTRDPHSGFRDRICSPGGSGQNECPGWRSVEQTVTGCLQQMWDEGPGEPFSEHGHYINMTNPRFSRVACGFHTTSDGRVWAIQNFQ